MIHGVVKICEMWTLFISLLLHQLSLCSPLGAVVPFGSLWLHPQSEHLLKDHCFDRSSAYHSYTSTSAVHLCTGPEEGRWSWMGDWLICSEAGFLLLAVKGWWMLSSPCWCLLKISVTSTSRSGVRFSEKLVNVIIEEEPVFKNIINLNNPPAIIFTPRP